LIVFQDSFYKEHTPEELELAFSNQYDFDHPDAIDMPMFAAVRSAIKYLLDSMLTYSAVPRRLEERTTDEHPCLFLHGASETEREEVPLRCRGYH
jgi:uridine kinase